MVAVGGGAILSPLVSPELLGRLTKFKRHSISRENMLRENYFHWPLGYWWRHRSGQRSNVSPFTDVLWNAHNIEQNEFYRKQSIERQLPSTHIANRGHCYQVRSQMAGHQSSTHEINFDRAVWCMFYGQFSFTTQWNWLDDHQRQVSFFLVKIRSRLG